MSRPVAPINPDLPTVVLAGRPNVTIRVSPADNHLFFSGTGPFPADGLPVHLHAI